MEDMLPTRDIDDAPDAAALCARFRDSMTDLVRQYPELVLVEDEFEAAIRHDADPLKEIASILGACRDVFIGLRHLLNPIGVPLRATADGRIQTLTLDNVATFVTDIRGFTELTENIGQRWGVNVFDLLSFCYFPHVVEVLNRYECNYLNYTGDGLLVLSRERKGKGGAILPGLDNSVLCALEMTGVTNCIAETWRRLGLVQSSGVWHETGIGLTSGTVQVGDPFVPDRNPSGKLAEFDTLFRSLVPQAAPSFQPRINYAQQIMGIHALGPVINRASRLQDTDKTAPDHTCMMTETEMKLLCPLLQERFERVGTIYLKGLGNADVFGFLRFEPVDVASLEKACWAYYASR